MKKRRTKKNSPPPGSGWYSDRYELKVDAVFGPREQRAGYQEYVVIETVHPRMGGASSKTVVDRDSRGRKMTMPEMAEDVAAKMADALSGGINLGSPNPVKVYDTRGHVIYQSVHGSKAPAGYVAPAGVARPVPFL